MPITLGWMNQPTHVPATASRRLARRFGLIALLIGSLLVIGACDGSGGSDSGGELIEPEVGVNFAKRFHVDPEIKAAHPELSEFITAGLQAVYRGDYAAYRRLVARNQNPESESRFKLICQSLESVRVESVESIALPDVPPPSYRVVVAFAFEPDSPAATRLRSRSVALLVIQEHDEWRLLIAPPKLQPRDEPTAEPATTPATQADKNPVDYPWDVGVDD